MLDQLLLKITDANNKLNRTFWWWFLRNPSIEVTVITAAATECYFSQVIAAVYTIGQITDNTGSIAMHRAVWQINLVWFWCHVTHHRFLCCNTSFRNFYFMKIFSWKIEINNWGNWDNWVIGATFTFTR